MAYSCVLTWRPAAALSQSPAICPLQLPENCPLEAFYGSARQSLILDAQGKLWETTVPRTNTEESPVIRPLPVFGTDPIAGIACNEFVAFAWTSVGMSYVWGLDAGQTGLLGVPDTFETASPLTIPGLSSVRVVSMAVGSTHAAAVDGTL